MLINEEFKAKVTAVFAKWEIEKQSKKDISKISEDLAQLLVARQNVDDMSPFFKIVLDAMEASSAGATNKFKIEVMKRVARQDSFQETLDVGIHVLSGSDQLEKKNKSAP